MPTGTAPQESPRLLVFSPSHLLSPDTAKLKSCRLAMGRSTCEHWYRSMRANDTTNGLVDQRQIGDLTHHTGSYGRLQEGRCSYSLSCGRSLPPEALRTAAGSAWRPVTPRWQSAAVGEFSPAACAASQSGVNCPGRRAMYHHVQPVRRHEFRFTQSVFRGGWAHWRARDPHGPRI